jgi:GAF domain-containing protein/multidrug efflux pump subunit AcrA (membrane-fusion protein)
VANESEGPASRTEAEALGELARCENLAQTAGWAAKWSARIAAADGAIVWTPDTASQLFVCVAAEGEGTRPFLRRSVPRDKETVHALLRDKRSSTIDRKDFQASQDPLLKGLPAAVQSAVAIPLQAEGQVVALLELLFEQPVKPGQKMASVESFLRHAEVALDQAVKGEKKTVGMLQAIERLTNLYDLSKAFGSTIDLDELNQIIIRKAVDFSVAEVGSFWLLDAESADVVLAATAVNENYEVENPPDAVGSSIIGDVIANQKVILANKVPADVPLAAENEGHEVRSVLAIPLIEDKKPVGGLILVNKRGRQPMFTAEDEELLTDLSRGAVRALRNARQYEAEKKVEELDALLAVSREITATLDLDKVMQKIVNAAHAIVAYDQCAIAILDRGKVKLGAISGMLTIDRKNARVQDTEALLEWVFISGSDVAVSQDADGKIEADRPETEEKFRAFFAQSGFRSFHGLLLADEEGKLGVLAFFRKTPLIVGGGDLLSILVNQATVAVRNAQLYRQVPVPGFLKPLAERRRRFQEMPSRRRLTWTIAAVVVLILLFAVPWRLRVAGPARVLPGRRAAVTAGVDGTVMSVLHHEGDTVKAGDLIATLDPESYRAALEDARSAYRISESEVTKFRESGDSPNMFEAASRRDEAKAKLELEEDRLNRTSLRAPTSGVIVTPRIEERVGQLLTRGAELCVIADAGSVVAEVAVPESDAFLVHAGQPVAVKLNTYPTRIFRGTVARPGSHVRLEEKESFVIAEVQIENAAGLLKTGMQGKAKISTERVPIVTAILRDPIRWAWNKIWPILP